MRRACLVAGCPALTSRTRCPAHERAWQAARNARPERAIYRGSWPAESRAIRAAQPWCSACGSGGDLTVDHPTRAVLCRRCHGRLEARRRAQGREGYTHSLKPGPYPLPVIRERNLHDA